MRFPVSYEIAKKSGSNFYSSFFFLPKRQREALTVLYAVSRLLDDVVDEAAGETSNARKEIDLWRKRIDEIYRGGEETSHPILQELREVVVQFHLKEEYLKDLITGIEMDLEKKNYQTFQELEQYCYHVAGTVGLLCNQIFGFDDNQARQYALLLGTAFQLTNIVRDVGVDLAKGRVYLPLEERLKFGYPDEELLGRRQTDGFFRLMNFQADRAEDYFRRADACLKNGERRRLKAAQVMRGVYYRLLRKLRSRNFPVFSEKVSLSTWEKIGVVVRVLFCRPPRTLFSAGSEDYSLDASNLTPTIKEPIRRTEGK